MIQMFKILVTRCQRKCKILAVQSLDRLTHGDAFCFLTLSGAGTSGGELEDESWKPPDPELIQKLVAQIEYYLSDENLEHDAFLLKHVRRNKLGFVSVKLLTSFKKVTTECPAHSCDVGWMCRQGPTPVPVRETGGPRVNKHVHRLSVRSLSTVIGVLISSVEQHFCWRVDLNRMKGDFERRILC